MVDLDGFEFDAEKTEKFDDDRLFYTKTVQLNKDIQENIFTSTVTIRAIEPGNWVIGYTGSQINITVGEEESFLVDYFPRKLSDYISIASQISTPTYLSFDDILALSNEQLYDFDEIPSLSEKEINDLQEVLSIHEFSLIIQNQTINSEPLSFLEPLNTNEITETWA